MVARFCGFVKLLCELCPTNTQQFYRLFVVAGFSPGDLVPLCPGGRERTPQTPPDFNQLRSVLSQATTQSLQVLTRPNLGNHPA